MFVHFFYLNLINGYGVRPLFGGPPKLTTTHTNPPGCVETDVSVADGLGLEADDYIEKPVEPEELLRKVNKLLKRREDTFNLG